MSHGRNKDQSRKNRAKVVLMCLTFNRGAQRFCLPLVLNRQVHFRA